MKQRELVIRRGPVYWEVKFREQNDSKFRTTKIPLRPVCSGLKDCKFCKGIMVQGVLIMSPVDVAPGRQPVHVISPSMASHLVAFEWGQQHPNEPFVVGWLLTDEERMAGKKGTLWPE